MYEIPGQKQNWHFAGFKFGGEPIISIPVLYALWN